MKPDFIAKAMIKIHAPVSKVWEALTQPELIKQYLFGTETSTDWKEGSSIIYRGVYEGKKYEDKGTIKKIEKNRVLQTTYWSSMSGKEDKPENYNTVTYFLNEDGGNTFLTVTQDNNESEASRDHSQQNWVMVLNKLKEVVEEK